MCYGAKAEKAGNIAGHACITRTGATATPTPTTTPTTAPHVNVFTCSLDRCKGVCCEGAPEWLGCSACGEVLLLTCCAAARFCLSLALIFLIVALPPQCLRDVAVSVAVVLWWRRAARWQRIEAQ